QSISGRIIANDGTKTDLIRRQWLPEGAVISTAAGLSSILEDATEEAVFRIRPSGELEAVTGTNGNWFVTVVAAQDEGKGVAALRNFATIQINPLTARTSIYRP